VGKPEGNGPVIKPRRRWDVKINMDLKELGLRRMDWIYERLPKNSRNLAIKRVSYSNS
jgi:hypothetical protein